VIDTQTSVLELRGVDGGYDGTRVLHDINLTVPRGSVVALLGANGAGKTTTILTLAGALSPLSGEVRWEGEVTRAPLHRRARHGLTLVTEEKSVFMRLTVLENLRVGGVKVDRLLQLFPELEPRLKVAAGDLSGGEQQMLTLARALGRDPEVLLADELSAGLAPIIVDRLLRALRDAVDTLGVGVLLVEQHVHEALRFADRAYVMSKGVVEVSGSAAEVRASMGEVEASYFGGVAHGEVQA
jgi:branched-chain amino acid transport system ATP-binding protein